ncbi:hypothetical protein ABT340_39695 [Streptosporangium sp. NPDC000239]|uniref:hypothetical protein n=1 Tax=Streptosporangium sp. NPDC000239 TaxID=3154248 RepID=UPI003329959D
MAVRYRWMVCDLLTDAFIADLPLVVQEYDHRINQAGVISASMTIPNQRINRLVDKVVPRDINDLSAGPGRLVLHCIRQCAGRPDDLWGSYWLWRAKTSQGRAGPPKIEFNGMGLDGYLKQVEARDVFERLSTDVATIGRDLLTTALARPYANIGVTMPAGTTGVTQDLIIRPTDKQSYGAAFEKLAEGAFEYHFDTRLDEAGQRVRILDWAYPRLGEISTRHDFSQPGNVLEWSEDVDALRGGTSYVARGDTSNSDITGESLPTLSDPADATDYHTAGWARLDRTLDRPGTADLTALQQYASYWATTSPGPVRLHSVTVRLADNPSLTPHRLGDYATIRLVNQRYPRVDGVASFVRSWRVIGMAIRPPKRGNSVEEAELLFEEQVA